MRIILAMAVWFSIAEGGLFGQQIPALVPDAIFHNGKIVTVDSAFSIQEAFAVEGDHFLAVGSNVKMRALADPSTRLIDLRGSTVIPGLTAMDPANSQYWAVVSKFAGIKVDMNGVRSLAEMLNRIKQATAKPGQSLLTVDIGYWDESEVSEKRAPTRQELDQISPERPLMIATPGPASHVSQSKAFLNTAALKAARIGRETKLFNGYPIPKDASGEPTGVIINRATIVGVYVKLAAEEEKKELILKLQQQQNALGYTNLWAQGQIPDVMRVYSSVWREGKLTIRVSMGLDIAPAETNKLEEILSFWGVGSGFGDQWLRLGSPGAGPFLDGDGAQLLLREPPLEPYPNFVSPESRWGTSAEIYRQAMFTMNRFGWRPAPKISGDKALDIALDAYEAADRQSSIRDKRWIVASNYVVQPDQMKRMAQLGVLYCSSVPNLNWVDLYIRFWGQERAQRAWPTRDLLDHHLIVSGGGGFEDIYFYVTRKTVDGKLWGASQKISREEALRISTINNAYMTFEEKVKGSIESSKLADFVILDRDILTVPEDEIRSIRPVATYVGGRKVFSSKGSDL
ncbi:MAG: amidohydrolase [Acidobacteria bacterium]|nr:amidohydrolase [Acidobacteriota bacterium]